MQAASLPTSAPVVGTVFYHDDELQCEVTVGEPDPQFAKLLRQAIGGAEGEMRVALQYMFQAFAFPAEKAEIPEYLIARDTMHQN